MRRQDTDNSRSGGDSGDGSQSDLGTPVHLQWRQVDAPGAIGPGPREGVNEIANDTRFSTAVLSLVFTLPLSVRSQEAGGLYELLCFHAQQAAEKSLKAVLIHYGIEPPRTHNLERLIDLLPASMTRERVLTQSARLTIFATSSRYPGSQERVDEDEYIEAVRLAQDVVNWAAAMLE